MRAIFALPIVFFITVYVSSTGKAEARAAWLCTPCQSQEECDLDPIDYCMWGEARNSCNRKVCAKGPSDRCGGHRDIFGKCGNGMWCQKEEESNLYTCHGCYDNSLECHQSRRY